MGIAEFEATTETFDELVLGPRGELVVVDFWGEGCPNCDVFAAQKPSLLKALRGKKVRFVRVNAYVHDALARRFALFGIPSFLLFRDGKLLGRMSEYYGRQHWLEVVEDNLPPPQKRP